MGYIFLNLNSGVLQQMLKWSWILTLTLFGITAFNTPCQAQHEDSNWMICNGKVILSFTDNDVSLQQIEQSFRTRYNSSCISSKGDYLLFYTNGCQINGADHEILINGDSINPGTEFELQCEVGYLGTQGSMFLPHPGDSNLYYLFHLGLDWFPPHYSVGHRFYYSLIDRSVGYGEVLEKNQLLLQDTFTVGLITAVRHANGRDWWIVQPEMASNKLYTFLLDPEGIHGPWEQRIGTVDQDDSHTGQVCFSPDGRYYARVDGYNELHLYEFDRCSGAFFNHQYVNLPTVGPNLTLFAGVAFSSNSQLLYVSRPEYLYQLDIRSDDLQASLTQIAAFDGYGEPFPGYFQILQLAPNDKIYLTDGNANPYLSVINSPNELGQACDFTQHSFSLPEQNFFSLPNLPHFSLGREEGSPCDTLFEAPELPACSGSEVKVFPNPFQKTLTIRMNDCTLSNNEFRLYDVLGRTIWIEMIAEVGADQEILLPNFAAGVYFYQIRNSDRVLQSGKLIRHY
jgi:hypothetical protein